MGVQTDPYSAADYEVQVSIPLVQPINIKPPTQMPIMTSLLPSPF
jgi:hypothetical protein